MYLCHSTGCTYILKGIYQYYYPQGDIQEVQDGSFSIIHGKLSREFKSKIYVDYNLLIVNEPSLFDIMEYIEK